MPFDLHFLTRYATPEALTAVAALGGLYAAWRVSSWLVRTLASAALRICVTPVLLGALFVGGLGTAGVGVGRWAEWCCAPSSASASDPEPMSVLFGRCGRSVQPDEVRAYAEYLKVLHGPAAGHVAAPRVAKEDRPRMDVSIGLLFAGAGAALVAALCGIFLPLIPDPGAGGE
jgi:hypothetical protein